MFNSLMFYPNYHLANWIKVYWLLKGNGVGKNFKRQYILPDGCTTILFVLKGEIILETYHNNVIKKGIHIVPPTLEPHYDLISDDIFFIDVHLIPGMFYELFGLHVKELEEKIYSFKDISIDFDDTFFLQLLQLQNDQEKLIHQIDNFFIHLFHKKNFTPTPLLYSLEQLYKIGNLDSFYSMQSLSSRQVQRKVKSMTGITPKAISSFGRFYNILENFSFSKECLEFADIAIGAGYTDQSHFIKDFKKFTRTSPKKFLNMQDEYLQYKAISSKISFL